MYTSPVFRAFLLFFALFGACVSLPAQERSVTSVRVADETGATLAGAHMVLQGAAGAAAVEVTTGPGGTATLAARSGHYQVTISHKGFETLTRELDLPASPMTFVLTIAGDRQSVEVDADTFKTDTAATATRMSVSLLDTPQQVQVLNSELLRSRAVESMKQAVEMVPSVGLQLGEGRRDNFVIRGFNAVTDMYIDGVRDDAQYYRDLSNTERIEIVEGPAAVLYGRGSSGGLINRVTRKPSMEGTLGEFTYMAGSYGEQRGTADLDTLVPATGNKLGLRVTGAAEHEGSQRHFYWEDRYAFAPTLAFHPSEATAVTAQVERLRDDRLPDRGIPFLPSTGAPAAVPVGNFYGYVGAGRGGNFIHSAVTDGTLDERHAFAGGWSAHAVQHLAGYTTSFTNMYATSVTPVAGSSNDFLVGRGEYDGTQNWRTAFANLEATRTARWLGLNQTLLVGTEYGREVTDSTQFNGPTNQTPVDLWNPAQVAPVLSNVLSRNNRFFAQTLAVYAQDLVALSDHWKALAGVRFDDFRQALDLRPPTNTTPNLGRTDNAFSPRVGLVYSARPWASVYGNYSRTFDPSGENLSLAVNNAQLQPEVTQNYESGAKLDLLQSRLLVTSSLFRLDRTNVKTTDPNNPTALLNLGEQRTQGAEVNVQGSPRRHWQVAGGYAWLDGRIVSSTTLSNGVSLQGRRPAMTPLHSGSLWTTRSFGKGFGGGFGLITRAAQFAATDNLARLPAFVRLDGTVYYRARHFELQANLQNLADQRYFDAAQSDYQIYPAAPISGTVTSRWRF